MKDTAMAGNKPYQITTLNHVIRSYLLFTIVYFSSVAVSCNEDLTLLLRAGNAAKQMNKVIVIFCLRETF